MFESTCKPAVLNQHFQIHIFKLTCQINIIPNQHSQSNGKHPGRSDSPGPQRAPGPQREFRKSTTFFKSKKRCVAVKIAFFCSSTFALALFSAITGANLCIVLKKFYFFNK